MTEAFRVADRSGHVAAIDDLEGAAPDKPWTTTLRCLISNRVYLGEVS